MINQNETVFSLEAVSYTYRGGITALEDVSFEVASGECWAILGANGSGKSTLLKLLDGLAFPSQGRIAAFGQHLSEKRFNEEAFNYAFRKRVGFVFQNPDVQLFSASVLDEVAFAPLQLGLGQAEVEKRLQQAMEALNITKLAERPPHHLSGGEKKRVALASVLSLQPEVWLLDEPTAGLDPRSQSWLVEFISQRHTAGETIIIATHDLSIIQRVATHCLVFGEDHRLAATGLPASILADHTLLHACNLIHEHAPVGILP
ncbi:MAG: energy-coupling factor ABC transporter ATP-binding protein [Anaerolineae bacterium]